MLGDNLYGSQGAADFVRKFERPYKPLLDGGVKFYASLGNHDKTSNYQYKLFNMGGERYYTYAREANARFFVLDSELPGSGAARLAGARAQETHGGVEDRLLPSPAVFRRGTSRLGGRAARAPRADVREVRRERGLLWTRSRLRPHQTAEGHLLLRLGRRRASCGGAISNARPSPPPASTRTAASCSTRSPATTSSSRSSRGPDRRSIRA